MSDVNEQREAALKNCTHIEKAHPDLTPVLETIRAALQPAPVVDVEGLKTNTHEAFTHRFDAMPKKIHGEYEIEWAIDYLHKQGHLHPTKVSDTRRIENMGSGRG